MSNAVKHQQALRKRNRRSNPVPFAQRTWASKSECVNQGAAGKRKIAELIAEGRIQTTVLDGREYVLVQSYLSAVNAGLGQRLPEPVQMSRALTAKKAEQGAAS